MMRRLMALNTQVGNYFLVVVTLNNNEEAIRYHFSVGPAGHRGRERQ